MIYFVEPLYMDSYTTPISKELIHTCVSGVIWILKVRIGLLMENRFVLMNDGNVVDEVCMINVRKSWYRT